MNIFSKVSLLGTKNWTSAVQSPELATQTGWRSITYGNGIYLAKKFNAKYLSTSTDGINWATPYEAVGSDQYNTFKNTLSLAYGNGVFVALASNSGFVSTDAINWSEASTGISLLRGTNLIFDGEKFVIVDAQRSSLWTSTDGVNWEETSGSFSGALYLAFNGSKYVINGQNGMMITSTDLINWTETQPTGISSGFASGMYMGYDGLRFFGWNTVGGQISYSTNGINWTTPVTDSNLGNHDWVASTTNDIKTVLISSNGYITTKRV